MAAKAKGAVAFARDVNLRSKREGLTDAAAALAFWTFVSFLPTLIALVSLVGAMELFLGEEKAEEVRRDILQRLDEVLARGELQQVRDVVEDIINTPRGAIAITGFAIALWSMSKGFASLCRSLARLHGVPETRAGIKGSLYGLALGAGSVTLLTVLLAQLALGPLFGIGDADGWVVDAWSWVRGPFLLAVGFGWLLLLLKLGSGLRRPLRDFLPGAAAAAVLVTVVAIGTVAILRLGLLKANPVYGALGGLLLLLTFLHLFARLVLMGGLVNAHRFELEAERLVAPLPREPVEAGAGAHAIAVGLLAAAVLRRR